MNIAVGADATTLFRAAYENRYTWDSSFPGYTADVTYRCGDQVFQGQAKVSPDPRMGYKGEVTGIEDEEVLKAIQGQLWETAIHRVRRAFEQTHGANTFTFGETDESGAVEIIMGGKATGDRYKVRNNEVVLVHRHIHGNVVTINTFSTYETGAGYLSHTYDSVYHDPQTGVQTSPKQLFEDSYEEVNGYTVLNKRVITTEDNSQPVEFVFTNIQLLA
ncbi:DUF3386 domain-containing protein [Alkalinema sp. FACHB-956]|uniref:DUF3386 domain-containing protein n=1 Tax=Alkalinema sp. FACHB-956 TaxID=2692768 RepID=UPI001689EEDB|nr:DUF3386 domain-containing protein [Alkalinema sp. FACHB-956]MBD2328874.1 DUF3386 domain-containing protein [Alkalinema sp. FACHB-956]